MEELLLNYFTDLLKGVNLYDFSMVEKLEYDIDSLIGEIKQTEDYKEDKVSDFFQEEIVPMLLDKLKDLFKEEIERRGELSDMLYEIDMDYEDIFEAESINGINEEIIYKIYEKENFVHYADAMRYLASNDNSLLESLSLANEYGISVGNLNSCMLANLLYIKHMLEDYDDLKGDIEELIEFKNRFVFDITYTFENAIVKS